MPKEPDIQALILGAYILHLIAEANGGAEPRTIWQYRRAAARFGVKIRLVAPDKINQSCLRRGVIYLRKTRHPQRLRRELLHELAEAACQWEGVPPCVCSVSRHQVASLLDKEYSHG